MLLKERLLEAASGDDAKQMLVRANPTARWDIFAADSTQSIAYFSVRAETLAEVNEMFRRLETGGVALTQLELVLSKIKSVQSDYEEELAVVTSFTKRRLVCGTAMRGPQSTLSAERCASGSPSSACVGQTVEKALLKMV